MNQIASGIMIGIIMGYFLFYIIYKGFMIKDTTMDIQYFDGSWIKGVRKKSYIQQETHGTHHFMVIDTSESLKHLIGKRVAIPINSVKYFEIKER